MIFRSPSQRLLSAYHFDKHLWGSEMKDSMKTVGARHLIRWREWIAATATDARSFAAAPGVAGCASKMIQGCYCATRPREIPGDEAPAFKPRQDVACPWGWRTMDASFAEKAASRVHRFAFVGLQETYNATVCLFHHTFGGDVDPAEFGLFNVGYESRSDKGGLSPKKADFFRHQKYGLSSQKTVAAWDEAPLGDFVDVYDEHVYSAALRRFETDLERVLRNVEKGAPAKRFADTPRNTKKRKRPYRALSAEPTPRASAPSNSTGGAPSRGGQS